VARRGTQIAVDGRISRAMRSRQAICDACLDLVQEGVLLPSADQIADRAGLSRRSIFYHFSDLAALYDAVSEAGMQRCAPLLAEIPAGAPVAERVSLLADVRSRFLEATTPFRRALTAQALTSPASGQAVRVGRDFLRRQRDEIERLFGHDLDHLPPQDRADTLEAMSAATSPPMWELLRFSRGLSMSRARAVLERSLTALLREAGVAVG
jgi:AcrR family transcriptional regulator